ncbi:MAG: 50S ribosome-binding GTPase [Planctomycetia bacterium]|nr:50S ribosome-binding GTPase [Planctomycetia bacterium]
MNQDVVCCLTPAGVSALAVVGLRGPCAWQKLAPFFSGSKQTPVLSEKPRLYLGMLQRDGLGDQVVLMLKGSPRHQEIELQLHGGPGTVAWCLQLARDLGFHELDWPDWEDDIRWKLLPVSLTKKMASMLLDQSPQAWKSAVASLQNRIHSKSEPTQTLRNEIQELRNWHAFGQHLVTPWKVLIAGPPNVGKSSLLNALIGYERAITSPIPGTTRDLVSATIAWKGYPIELIDTAGVRESTDQLEQEGIARAISASENADLILWLVDLSQSERAQPKQIQPDFFIGTKADLPRYYPDKVDYEVSSQTGIGLDALLHAIISKLIPQEPVPGQVLPLTLAHLEELRCLDQLLSESQSL